MILWVRLKDRESLCGLSQPKIVVLGGGSSEKCLGNALVNGLMLPRGSDLL